MTPEAQRIAIAEACGFSRAPEYDDTINVEKAWRCDGRLRYESDLPDYLNDLNAMHEAIRDKIAGNKELETRFIEELHKLQSYDADSEDVTSIFTYEMRDIIAECGWLSVAFLRTIGKWEE